MSYVDEIIEAVVNKDIANFLPEDIHYPLYGSKEKLIGDEVVHMKL